MQGLAFVYFEDAAVDVIHQLMHNSSSHEGDITVLYELRQVANWVIPDCHLRPNAKEEGLGCSGQKPGATRARNGGVAGGCV